MNTTGTVKFFNETKWFWFIKDDQTGNDVFVHITALNASGIDTLKEDDKVSFEIAKSPKWDNAVNIKML